MMASQPAVVSPPDDPGFGELRAGPLGVRVAATAAEVDAALALRYRVFYDEMGATPDPLCTATRRDRVVSPGVAAPDRT